MLWQYLAASCCSIAAASQDHEGSQGLPPGSRKEWQVLELQISSFVQKTLYMILLYLCPTFIAGQFTFLKELLDETQLTIRDQTLTHFFSLLHESDLWQEHPQVRGSNTVYNYTSLSHPKLHPVFDENCLYTINLLLN